MARNNVPESHRDALEYREIIRRLRAREQRPFRIPELNEDPSADSQCNIWMLADGRLRWRDHLGVVRQATAAVTGSSTSAVTLPVADDPQEYVNEYVGTWTASYFNDGTERDTDDLFFGAEDSVSGVQHSQVGFDYTVIAADLAGAEVVRVELFLGLLNALGDQVNVFVGTHNNITAPATWSAVAYKVSTKLWSRGGHWHTISNSIGEGLRDGTIKGIVLDPRNDNTGYYGQAAGLTSSGQPPTLRITYVV